jgi:manganese/iron transport system permease protein
LPSLWAADQLPRRLASYYLDGATGGIIVVAQTLLFLLAFVFAPKHGLLASRRRAREAP